MQKRKVSLLSLSMLVGIVLTGGLHTNPVLAAGSPEVHREVHRDVHRVGPRGGVLDRHVFRKFHRDGRDVHRRVERDVHRVGPRGGVVDRHVRIEFHREDGFLKRKVSRDVLRIRPNGRKVERHVDRVRVVRTGDRLGHHHY